MWWFYISDASIIMWFSCDGTSTHTQTGREREGWHSPPPSSSTVWVNPGMAVPILFILFSCLRVWFRHKTPTHEVISGQNYLLFHKSKVKEIRWYSAATFNKLALHNIVVSCLFFLTTAIRWCDGGKAERVKSNGNNVAEKWTSSPFCSQKHKLCCFEFWPSKEKQTKLKWQQKTFWK